jgi:hypothetical protein
VSGKEKKQEEFHWNQKEIMTAVVPAAEAGSNSRSFDSDRE